MEYRQLHISYVPTEEMKASEAGKLKALMVSSLVDCAVHFQAQCHCLTVTDSVLPEPPQYGSKAYLERG